jgi:uncharacterized protein involved in exopolysaccharide biosynthesis
MGFLERMGAAVKPWLPPLSYGLVAGVLGAVLSLVLPPTFVSTGEVTLSTSSQASLSGSLLGLAAQFGLATAPSEGTPSFLVALLGSEDLREAVVRAPLPRAAHQGIRSPSCAPEASACDLIAIWAVTGRNSRDTLERAARLLLNSFTANVDPATGLVRLSVRARTPLLAKTVADGLLAALDSASLALQRRAAESQFRFLDVQVDSARDALHRAEDALERFDLANRSGPETSPALRLQRVRLQRDLTLSETFYTQLTGTLQQVYLAAANTASTVSVVQTPNLPGRRDTPRRRIITLVAFGFGVLIWATRRYWGLLYPEVRRIVSAGVVGGSQRPRA